MVIALENWTFLWKEVWKSMLRLKKKAGVHLKKMFISLKMPYENASLYHLYFMIIIYFVLPTKSLYLFSTINYNNDTEFDSYTTKK